jgi:hypothetical protein
MLTISTSSEQTKKTVSFLVESVKVCFVDFVYFSSLVQEVFCVPSQFISYRSLPLTSFHLDQHLLNFIPGQKTIPVDIIFFENFLQQSLNFLFLETFLSPNLR